MAERWAHETEDTAGGRSSTVRGDDQPAAGPEGASPEDARSPGPQPAPEAEEDGRRWAANWRAKEIRWLHTQVAELEQRLRRRTMALGVALAVSALLAVAVVSLAVALWYAPEPPPVAAGPETAPPVAERPLVRETPADGEVPTAGPSPEPAEPAAADAEPAPDGGRPQEIAVPPPPPAGAERADEAEGPAEEAEAPPSVGAEEPEGPPTETLTEETADEEAPDGAPPTEAVLDALSDMNERMAEEIERLQREAASP